MNFEWPSVSSVSFSGFLPVWLAWLCLHYGSTVCELHLCSRLYLLLCPILLEGTCAIPNLSLRLVGCTIPN